MLRVFVAVLILALPVLADSPTELNDKSFTALRDRIRPSGVEQSVDKVAWHPTLWDGLMTAQKEDKPILMWAMNGHPLACT